MPLFRPVYQVIEAIQFTGTNVLDCLAFTGKCANFHKWFNTDQDYVDHVAQHGNIFKVFYGNGTKLKFCKGDWVIRGPHGIYRLNNEDFVAQFQPLYPEN